VSDALNRLEPLRHVRTDPLEVAYCEAGPPDGDAPSGSGNVAFCADSDHGAADRSTAEVYGPGARVCPHCDGLEPSS
jgi:hypothetical protein